MAESSKTPRKSLYQKTRWEEKVYERLMRMKQGKNKEIHNREYIYYFQQQYSIMMVQQYKKCQIISAAALELRYTFLLSCQNMWWQQNIIMVIDITRNRNKTYQIMSTAYLLTNLSTRFAIVDYFLLCFYWMLLFFSTNSTKKSFSLLVTVFG